MRGKATFGRFFTVANTAFLCLLLVAGPPGCKKQADQAGGKQETEAVSSAVPHEAVVGEQQRQRTGAEEYANQLVFDLQEVSVFDLSDEISQEFLRGQMTICDNQSNRVWPCKSPDFESDKPLYGSVGFSGRFAGSVPPSGMYYLAIDESAGTGTGYDRLYFDCDGDGDLSDEKPLKSLKDPPRAALRQYSSTELQVCFESFEVTFDYGSAGKHAVEIMARLMAHDRSPRLTVFATKVRRGEVEISDAKYEALLGYGYSVGMPFDRPGTVFHLIPKSDSQDPPRWLGANQLNSMHGIGGECYRFATTPLGDKLFARPYKGQFGTFEVSTGGRDVQKVTVQGSLRCEDTAVAVAAELERGRPEPIKSCRLPEGDYLPAYLTIELGNVRIDVSNNYHSDGRPRGGTSRNRVYGIQIRKDKPFVLDFANKPEVLFASPAENMQVRPGGTLQVKAVLIDPKLDMMIRRISDTSRTEKVEYTMPDGQKRTLERGLLLNPKVFITRADGEKVTEGVMPFG